MDYAYMYTLTDPRMNIVRYVGSANHPLTRLSKHFRNSHNEEVNVWIEELRALGMEPLCATVRMVPKADRDKEERLLIAAHESDYLLNVTMRSRGPRWQPQVQIVERIVEKHVHWVETETVYIESDSDPVILARLEGIADQAAWLVQELEEARAGMQMLFEEAHPELAEDPDLEDGCDLEEEPDREDEPDDELEPDDEAEPLETGDIDTEWDDWVLKPIDRYRIAARTPQIRMEL